MTGYTQVFGGTSLYPSDVSYLALSLTGNVTLEWPLEASTANPLAASVIDVSPTGPGFAITMPDATLSSVGVTVLFNNLGPSTITIKDAAGGTLLSIVAGTQWQVYLTDNSFAAGSWRTFQFGASTAQAQASALAGFGLTATGSTLSVSETVTTFNSSFTLPAGARGAAYVWTGALGTASLIAASTLGNNWFTDIRNSGTGNLTIDPASSELINGAPTLVLVPGDSCRIVTDGAAWYTFGLGRSATFAFDYTVVNLTGQASPYVLSGSELNRVAYRFTGTLTTNMEIVVPATTQQYWVDNSTTGGSYTLGLRTAAQSPAITIVRNTRGIYYCDGSNFLDADTGGVATPIGVLDGGTGSTTASGARINLGAAASGANSDITSLTGLTTALAPAYGGTGATGTPSDGQLLIGNGTNYTLSTLTAGSGISITNASGAITITNTGGGGGGGGGGTVTSVAASGGTTGLSFTGSPITASGTLTLTGTLATANGGTGVTGTPTNGQLLIGNGSGYTLATLTAGSNVTITNSAGAITIAATGGGGGGSGTVTSVSGSGGSTGMSLSGGPITTSGTLTLGGTLALANGGTGSTTASGARAALDVPSTSGSGASGTWGISISGNAATATTATTANALNTGNSYTMAGLTVNGAITASGNVTAFSDDRLKTRTGRIENAVLKVMGLEGFYYEGNETAQSLGLNIERSVGVSAQTVGKVMPEVVKPAAVHSQFLAVDYSRLVPLLIEAIKEQQREIDDLVDSVAMLRGER